MNIFIAIIEQAYISIKYKKEYDWLEEDDTDEYLGLNSDSKVPDEINIKGGKQTAYEKEIFTKLRDAFEGITDGNNFGKGVPVDNHNIVTKKTLRDSPLVA